jgi:hypothetical protein
MIGIELNDNRVPDGDPDFSDQLADLIQSWSGRITMGEIVGSLEVHKMQIVIQNSDPEPD